MRKRTLLTLGSPRWQHRFEAELKRFDVRYHVLRGQPRRGTARRFTRGNLVEFLADGRDQLRCMLQAIEKARKRIDLEMYILRPDHAGQAVLEALVRAAQRGVTVRLLYDSVGCTGTTDDFFEPLVRAGGRLVEFNPLSPFRVRMNRLGQYLRWLPNRRDHRKLLVCDAPLASGEEGAIAFTGGRNIGDEYLTLPTGKGQWRDSGVMIRGPAAVQLSRLFDEMWRQGGGDDDRPPTLCCPPAGRQQVMVLGSTPGLANELHWAMRRIAHAATEAVRISCAYFIPNTFWRRALWSVVKRGLLCQVIVPLNSDVPPAGAACRHILGNLLKHGIEVFQYHGEMLHAKEVIYDQTLTVIGSSNMDQRSFRINYELAVLILDEEFARAVLAMHIQDLTSSDRYTLEMWKARSWWQKLTDWWWWQCRGQL